MNDEKRKNNRLQGRYSDEPRPSRKEKSKRKSDEGISKKKGLETKSLQPAEGVEVKYDEHASKSFSELEEKKPVEMNQCGECVLSQTENGISRVIFDRDFIPKDEADCMMNLILNSTKWHDKNIIIHGQEVPQPRLVAWYGPFPYTYSGAVLDAADMPPAILEIKDRIERYLEAYQLCVSFNSVLLNLYRDGKDSVAWHSDDELTMGISPTIASVSLGEIRKFQMKIKQNVCKNVKNLVSEDYFVKLTPGSLLIMDGCMQKDWKHQVPKEYHEKSARINLTFRTVYPIDKVPLQVPPKTVENSNQPSSTKTEAKHNIFDNTNFPSLESANSQNGSSSKVLKNSSVKSKSKTVPDVEVKANVSDQSYSIDVLPPVSNSNASENQDIMNESPSQDASSDVPDSKYQTDAVEDSNLNNESVSTSALLGTSYSEHPVVEDNPAIKSELNVDADEFIPKYMPNDSDKKDISESEYYKTPLAKLPDVYRDGKVPPSRYCEFYSVIADFFERDPEFLTERDFYEASTLDSLFQNGLSEENQKIVLGRLCSMIKNIVSKKNRPYRPLPPRSGYRNNYSRSRGPFKSSGGREKDYRD